MLSCNKCLGESLKDLKMKKKILVCALVGLTLSACNPSESNYAGDDGNPTTNGNGAYRVQESGMVLKSGGQKSVQAAGILVTLLTAGAKQIASSAGSSLGKGILKTFLGDPNQKIYDRFDQVDKKLTVIDNNVKEQLKLSDTTLGLLSSFILDQSEEWLNNKLTAIHNGLKPIGERDNKFEIGKIYGDMDSTELDKIYNYAQAHKDYRTLVEAGVVNANLIDPNGAKQHVRLGTPSPSTSVLYSNFQDEFIKNVDKNGNAVYSFKGTKAKLLAKLTELGLLNDQDMMGYINAYNYKIMDIKLQMLVSLQKLYNMQLVQLAYYYGVKANLDFEFTSSDPANPVPAQKDGLAGFKKAAQMLSNTYEANLDSLNKIFETHLPFITVADVVQQINYDWFDFQQPLLYNKTFLRSIDESAPLPISARQCEVSSLTFNSIGDSIKKYGLVNLGINCYLGNGTWKSASVVFPAVKDGAKIVRYAYHTIYATSSQKLSIGSSATAAKQLTPDDIKAFAEQTSSKDSIKDGNISDVVEPSNDPSLLLWVKKPKDKKDVVLFSTTKTYAGAFTSDITWAAGDIELKDNRNQITRILPVAYYDGNKGDNPPHLRRAQTDRTSSMNGEITYNIRFSKEEKIKDGRPRGTDPMTYFYNLASYRNHWFAIKMSMGYDGRSPLQTLGIGCINPDSSCSRVSNTTLRWDSGAQVKLIPPAVIEYGKGVDNEYQTLISGTGN